MLTCDGNLRFKHFRLWRNNKLTGIRHNMAKLLNVLFSNSFGRSSRVTESTFIRLDPTEEWLLLVEFSSAPFRVHYHTGAPNDDFLLNTLKTLFTLSRVLLDI